MKKTVLTGDRPSGNLHIGHYVGSLRKRVEMQNSGEYEIYVMIADLQALTDKVDRFQKSPGAVFEIMLDYLAVGLDPSKVNFVLQSGVPAVFELPMYYANLVTQARLERNPTVKSEISEKKFGRSIPVGFVFYPISQAADITAFGAHLVPVGNDQMPMIEQTREIVADFNRIYGETLVAPQGLLAQDKRAQRLVGTDGGAKMGKSLGNCIYIKDSAAELKAKVMSMYTDPTHIHATDPGKVEGNVVFEYLDVFCDDTHFAKFLPEYKNLDELKSHYKRGGLGDIKIKNFLYAVLDELLAPMRARRAECQKDKAAVMAMLAKGTAAAVKKTNEVLARVRKAIGITL
jgi:tryptophanyl-tRNA synthetase